MEVREAVERAKAALLDLMNLPFSSITGATKTEDGWQVTIELIERKGIPDTQDLLGVYEVTLNEDSHMTGYARRRVRRRMDLEEVIE